MVRQQKCLNIQPEPSFMISVYFYIMALFQYKKHVLRWIHKAD